MYSYGFVKVQNAYRGGAASIYLKKINVFPFYHYIYKMILNSQRR